MIQDRKYLKDISFLMDLTKRRNKEVYIKVISLDFATENEIGEIEGLIISGNLSVDGSSAVRRSGSLSIFCNTKLYESDTLARDINYYKHFFGISKKIDIEIGLNNDIDEKYPKVVWFQMGRYVLTNATFANNINGGVTININIGDKMNLLNGYCGGTITSSVEVDKVSDIDETGKIYERRASIYEMILEMVNHLGGEELGRILISDLETTTKTGLRIKSDSDKKYYLDKSGDKIIVKEYVEDKSPAGVEVFSAGDFIGYQDIDYTYPTKDYFTLNSGDSVVTGLDKIKSTLGNYEYFYDLDGNFRWQEIKNYKNTNKATMDLRNLKNEDYLIDRDNGSAFYNFEDSEIITSYNNSPQYSNLKNDFIIWGTRTVGEGSDKRTFPIRYHLAIDDKPEVPQEFSEDNIYLIIEDKDEETQEIKYKVPIYYERFSQLPAIGREDTIYFIKEDQELYRYDPVGNQYMKVFTKDIKNPTENNQFFYENYNKFFELSQSERSKKENEFSQIENEYSYIQDNTDKILNFLTEQQSLFNINMTKEDLLSLIKNLNSRLEDEYIILYDQLQVSLNNYINGDYRDESGNIIIYSKNKNLPKVSSFLDKINNSNFYVGYKKILNNLDIFYNNLFSIYKNTYERKINEYKKMLEKYYSYFVSYEEAKTNAEKNKIKDKANKLFSFSSTDILLLLDKLNQDFYVEKPNTIKYQKVLEQREKIFDNILINTGISKESYILNNNYKIGTDFSSSSSLKKYIENLSNLFDNKILNIFIKIFQAEFDLLINTYGAAFQKRWDDVVSSSELEETKEKILKSILITNLYPLSEMGYLLNDQFVSLYIYDNKDSFPVEIKDLKGIGLLDGSTGDIYIVSQKAGYYIASGLASVKYIFPQNWRTVLFLQNLDMYSSENNIYSTELNSEWGKLFDLIPYEDNNGAMHYKDKYVIYTDKIKDAVYKESDLLDYWLDFIDSKTMDFNELKISNIGRRTLVQKNDKVNCIFAPQIPDYIIIENTVENKEKIQNLEEQGQQYILVDSNFLEQCDTNGLTLYSAFDSISNSLYSYLGYNNTINITCLPMFFLEPNIRIKLRDESSDIYGDYIIKSFSISLNNLSTMNITCTKIIDSI